MPRKPEPALCAQCSNPFLSVKGGNGWTKCCSKSCAGKLRNAGRELVGPARDKARQRAKTHRRKTMGRHTDISLEYEQALRAKAKRCPLCQVRMTSKPYLPASKELDHMVPLNAGGTHTVGNVRIICRDCNIHRPKDGSDYLGPVTLWAQMPGFTRPAPKSKGLCPACGTKKIKSRCHSCNPLTMHLDRRAHGRQAATMRAAGMKWCDIATALGWANTGPCYLAAKAYGDPDVVASWPGRYTHPAVSRPPTFTPTAVVPRACKRCVAEFTPVRPWQVYCCYACARPPSRVASPVQLTLPLPPTKRRDHPRPKVAKPERTPKPVKPKRMLDVCVDCGDPALPRSRRCAECRAEVEDSDAA